MLTHGRERSAMVSVHSSSRPLSLSVYLAPLLHMRCMSTYIYMHTYIYICLLIGTSPPPRRRRRRRRQRHLCLFIYLPTMHCCLLLSCAAANPAMSRWPINCAVRPPPTNQLSRLATNSRPWLRYCRPRPERNELMTPPKTFFWYFTHHALHVASRDARGGARPHRSAQSHAPPAHVGEVVGPHKLVCLFVCLPQGGAVSAEPRVHGEGVRRRGGGWLQIYLSSQFALYLRTASVVKSQ